MSSDARQRNRSQANRVWAVLAVISFLWIALTIIPPILADRSMVAVSGPLYKFFSYICHQKPERSLHILGHQIAVCSRCFGVYFGILLGIAIYPLWRKIEDVEPLPRFWLFLSLVPIGIDWTLGVSGIWENNHASRLITGAILGIACATYIVPAVVEIARNLARISRSNIR